MKAEPVTPLAVFALVMTGGPSVILNVTTRLPVPVALVADTVTLLVATVVGVPEITPVLVFTLSPAGRPVALKLVGLLLAVIW